PFGIDGVIVHRVDDDVNVLNLNFEIVHHVESVRIPKRNIHHGYVRLQLSCGLHTGLRRALMADELDVHLVLDDTGKRLANGGMILNKEYSNLSGSHNEVMLFRGLSQARCTSRHRTPGLKTPFMRRYR